MCIGIKQKKQNTNTALCKWQILLLILIKEHLGKFKLYFSQRVSESSAGSVQAGDAGEREQRCRRPADAPRQVQGPRWTAAVSARRVPPPTGFPGVGCEAVE